MASRLDTFVKFRTSRTLSDALATKAEREGRTQSKVIRGVLSRELHRELAEAR
jgi:DNA topoisomerase IA